ncbi:hypothetical protein CAPTEDRAFT_186390 [Capitella teleta]|uniref:Uncharacterized protein n=1 Tax=Capitella teleta TaxID=283909 RepID=R7TYI5_CAPTE|nr:hypothetical protein CAPTEDRAFT_186390 [Capitella teleta]|eukprot:ELT98968.1 hypothetical protein CAPTEDRAFT_186390 [Capitella teleta]
MDLRVYLEGLLLMVSVYRCELCIFNANGLFVIVGVIWYLSAISDGCMFVYSLSQKYQLPSAYPSDILWYPARNGYTTEDRDEFYDYLHTRSREQTYESIPRRPPPYSTPTAQYGCGNIDRPAARYYLPPPIPTVHTVFHPVQSTVQRSFLLLGGRNVLSHKQGHSPDKHLTTLR